MNIITKKTVLYEVKNFIIGWLFSKKNESLFSLIRPVYLALSMAVYVSGTIPTYAQDKTEWRPLHNRPAVYLGEEHVDFPEYYTKGKYYGEGMQFIQGAAAHEDGTVLMAQDMGSARISQNFGKTWFTPKNEGNPLIGGNSCAIDPSNSNIMFIAMSSKYMGEKFKQLRQIEGIYRSENMGESWTLVQAIPNIQDVRFFMDNFACYPVSEGSVEDRIWRFATYNVNNTTPGGAEGYLWLSAAGGRSWQKIGSFPGSEVFSLVQHPSTSETLFLCTNEGLYKTEDGGKTWSQPWSHVLKGRAYSLWIDPDSNDYMLVSITSSNSSDRGIWETEDGGGTWKRILSNINPGQMSVGAKNEEGKRMIYVHNSAGSGDTKVRKFDGTWITPKGETLAAPPQEYWAQQSITGQTMSAFVPHPTIPDIALCHGRAFWWRSENNGGEVWQESSTNFFGSTFSEIFFDQNDWRKMYSVSPDSGTAETDNGGDSFKKSNVTGKEAGGQWARMLARGGSVNARTGRSNVVLPDPWPENAPPPVDPNAPGRRIMSLGGLLSHYIFSRDKGQTDWSDRIEDPLEEGGGPSSRRIRFSRQNPNIVYAGPNISRDGGKTWSMMSNSQRVAALSYHDGNTVYAVQKNGNQYDINKSTDQGVNWTKIHTTNGNIMLDNGFGHLWTDAHSEDRLYTLNSDRDVVLLKNTGTIWTTVDLNLRSKYDPLPISWNVKGICVDENVPGLIYALVDLSGQPIVWRGRMNKDFTACSWEDITLGAPRIAGSTHLSLHPVTGDLVLGTGNGTFVFPAPDDWEHKDPEKRQYKQALWNNLPLSFPKGPAIVKQPESTDVFENNSVTLLVEATGNSLSYQWFKDGNVLTNEISDRLTINSATQSNSGKYYCVVSNTSGSKRSGIAILTVLNDGVELKNIRINGENWENINEPYILCGSDDVYIEVTPLTHRSILIYNENVVENNIINLTIDREGITEINFTIQSEDNTMRKSYLIKINKLLEFDQLVKVKWNNTLVANNNSKTNGGYQFKSYRWFKDDILIGSNPSYSVGPRKDMLLDENAIYYLEATTIEDEVLRTCGSRITFLPQEHISIYPNPIYSKGYITIEIPQDNPDMENALIEIYTINGICISQQKAKGRYNTVSSFRNPGLYLIVVRASNFLESKKIIVR